MTTITITLSDEQAEMLRKKAAQYNVTPEELVQRGIDAMLAPQKPASVSENGVELELTEEERTRKLDAIVEDLLIRRKWLYEQLAKGPE